VVDAIDVHEQTVAAVQVAALRVAAGVQLIARGQQVDTVGTRVVEAEEPAMEVDENEKGPEKTSVA
jgi:hypothetical protein